MAQYPHHRLLDYLVLKCGYADWSLTTVRLGYPYPLRRLCSEPATLYPIVEVLYPDIQSLTVLLPCHIVYPGCRVAFERIVSIPKHFFCDMVHEAGETKVPIPCRCFTYPVKSVQCLPLSLRTGRRRLSRISPWSSAFPPEPPPPHGEHAALFGTFLGSTPMSDCSAACI